MCMIFPQAFVLPSACQYISECNQLHATPTFNKDTGGDINIKKNRLKHTNSVKCNYN